ncbi:MAG: hypothetical protein K6C05_02370 [Anaerovibrio sp.]|uniref:hypothetical protein n=1 Tax=Anaerovibrio sp. TaxID=1872532 RepID=UPI0025EDFB3F|nr:hypothetical protein [Anaerovibrio sp.]MCR5175674.1 hypothetical protein [Anaerovibrio sp.]
MSVVSDRLLEIRRATMPDDSLVTYAEFIGLGPNVYRKYENGEERVPQDIVSTISGRIGLPREIVDGTEKFDDFYKFFCRLVISQWRGREYPEI